MSAERDGSLLLTISLPLIATVLIVNCLELPFIVNCLEEESCWFSFSKPFLGFSPETNLSETLGVEKDKLVVW